jgi:hypothetical protein
MGTVRLRFTPPWGLLISRRLMFIGAFFALFTALGHAAFAEVAAAPSGAAPAAPGESSAEGSARDSAKVRFLRGVDFANRARWDAALAEFMASIELYPTRVARQNAAISLRELGRYAEALEMYRRLMTEFGAKLETDERGAIQTQMDALVGLTGELVIQTGAAGAVVVIDGEQRGTTPLAKSILVNSGTHSLRVFKPDFQPYEGVVVVAGGQTRTLIVSLEPLRQSGTLVVREAEGRVCDVALDGAVVGKTPWQGVLVPGRHSVQLRISAEAGSVPSLALVRRNETTTLALSTGKLDSALRVQPAPSNASVFIDGVEVGDGVWQGRLPSGQHRVEVASSGHIPDSRRVTLKTGESRALQITLERDLSDPRWHSGFVPHLALDVFGGLAWSPSLGGGADASCGGSVSADGREYERCSKRSPPLGFMLGARAGWVLRERLSLEVSFGYLSLKEKITRSLPAIFEQRQNQVFADALADSTHLQGPLAAVSASYRVAGPLRARLLLGLMRATVEASNRGHYIGVNGLDDPAPADVSIPERTMRLWIPLFGPELAAEFHVTRRLSLNAGLAALFLFPGDTPRTGTFQGEVTGRRRGQTKQGQQDGVLELPPEAALGTMMALLPNVGARMEF